MFLLTTPVDPLYRLDLFPVNRKRKIIRLQKSEVKNHSCRETGQVPLVPPNKPKSQLSKNDVPKHFCRAFYTWIENKCNTHESEQQNSVDQKIETEIKFFLDEKIKEAEVFLGGTQTRKNTHILLGLQEGIFWHHHLLIVLKVYFQKLITCTNKSGIECFQKPAKDVYFFITTWKNKNRFLCSLMALIWVNVIY